MYSKTDLFALVVLNEMLKVKKAKFACACEACVGRTLYRSKGLSVLLSGLYDPHSVQPFSRTPTELQRVV